MCVVVFFIFKNLRAPPSSSLIMRPELLAYERSASGSTKKSTDYLYGNACQVR
jgi:hypothetical protein